MNTKTCKNCGWVYPITQPGRKCKICGEVFDIIVCSTCGKPTPLERMESGKGTCKACAAAIDRTYVAKRRKLQSDAFDEWLAKVASVPKSYPTLTEDQWLEACRYFNGCARCHSDDIDTRGFFVGAELGGRYCDWNIIPLCEKCASRWNLTANVFINAERHDHTERVGEYRECLMNILDYLGGKLDAALGATGTPKRLTDCSK